MVAAAALHGLGMRELREFLADHEANLTLAETLIKNPEARTKKSMRELSEALEVPRLWFEAEDWRPLLQGDKSLAEIVRLAREGGGFSPEAGQEMGQHLAEAAERMMTAAQALLGNQQNAEDAEQTGERALEETTQSGETVHDTRVPKERKHQAG